MTSRVRKNSLHNYVEKSTSNSIFCFHSALYSIWILFFGFSAVLIRFNLCYSLVFLLLEPFYVFALSCFSFELFVRMSKKPRIIKNRAETQRDEQKLERVKSRVKVNNSLRKFVEKSTSSYNVVLCSAAYSFEYCFPSNSVLICMRCFKGAPFFFRLSLLLALGFHWFESCVCLFRSGLGFLWVVTR